MDTRSQGQHPLNINHSAEYFDSPTKTSTTSSTESEDTVAYEQDVEFANRHNLSPSSRQIAAKCLEDHHLRRAARVCSNPFSLYSCL
jgi:hypothetical protein